MQQACGKLLHRVLTYLLSYHLHVVSLCSCYNTPAISYDTIPPQWPFNLQCMAHMGTTVTGELWLSSRLHSCCNWTHISLAFITHSMGVILKPCELVCKVIYELSCRRHTHVRRGSLGENITLGQMEIRADQSFMFVAVVFMCVQVQIASGVECTFVSGSKCKCTLVDG